MLEHRSIARPADASAGIALGELCLHEAGWVETRDRATRIRSGTNQSGIGSVGANAPASKS